MLIIAPAKSESGCGRMNTKTIAGVVIFSSLAIVLNLSPIKIPAPFAPYLYYQVWEIPIVAAFFLYGAVAVILISAINTAALLVVFPGALPTGPLYNLAAVLSMLLGIGIVKILVEKHSPKHDTIVAALYTGFGVAIRTIFMVFIDYSLLGFPPPVGFSYPQELLIATIPLIAVFNATLALYTIPIGYSLGKIVSANSRTFK
jgi:riboflavin transporter FmnP